MRSEEQMRRELAAARIAVGLPVSGPWDSGYCHAQRDGDCISSECPQLRDGEPAESGRHCPIDLHADERGYQ